jgi:hypothetical protein
VLGRTISQRGNSGFERTELVVLAVDPFGVGPESVDGSWERENRHFETGTSIIAAIRGS